MVNTLTLNPAMDKILYIDRFQRDITNRAKRQLLTVGGKGTHVSITLQKLGIRNRAFGFGYGRTGQTIIRALEEQGIETRFFYSDQDDRESRTNYVIIEEAHGSSTTVAERGVEPTAREVEWLLDSLERDTAPSDALVLAGDASNFQDPLIYCRIMRRLKEKKARVFLDASGPSLKRSLEEGPYLIKPNRDELAELCGLAIQTDRDVLNALKKLERYDIPVIAVSLGGDGSVVKMGGEIYRVKPPKIDAVNTAGCGDSFLSGILYGLEKGLATEETLDYATAVSAAAAAWSLSIGFDEALRDSLLHKAKIVKL
ncbi:MAG: 1-phosphofructokinase family hexose kinase [Clostridiales bacterium]|nr:1-phosphofructokinase family hexose kinase [Clostridiales bacterium]